MPANNFSNQFLKLINHPVKYRIFLLTQLPAAFFSGVRIKEISETKCSVSVPFKWLTRNPFRSTYFASLAMAAELSTGALAMMHIYKSKPALSMLITSMRADYFKKATGKTVFLCEQGKQICDAVQQAILDNEPKNIPVKSVGRNKDGEIVAEFIFTWSFKVKANR